MKLGTKVTLVGVAISMVGVAGFVAACSSSSGSSTNGSYTSITPPGLPSGATQTTSTTEHNLALHKLYLGDVDPKTDAKFADAWKSIGYDLDGKNTSATSKDVCTQVTLAAPKIQQDGNGGIDNSFGENIVPLLSGFNASTNINKAISDGKFTVMIDSTGLPDTEPKDLSGLTAGLYIGGAFSDPDGGPQPTFTTADNWPVSGDFLNGGDLKSPKIKFGSSYVAAGTWVSGSFVDVPLSLSFSGVTLDITIHHGVLTFADTVSGAHKGTAGIIAGVIQVDELVSGIEKIAGHLDTSLCQGSTIESIKTQIKQAADIMNDGTNGTGATCNGISIGLGFTADEIKPPSTIAVKGAPAPDPCASGGDAGTTTGDASTD